MAKTNKEKIADLEKSAETNELVDRAQTASIKANTKAIIDQMDTNTEQEKKIKANKESSEKNAESIEAVEGKVAENRKAISEKVNKADQKLKDNVQDLAIKETNAKVNEVAESVYDAKVKQFQTDNDQDAKIRQSEDKHFINEKVDAQQSAMLLRLSDRVTTLNNALTSAEHKIVKLEKDNAILKIVGVISIIACIIVGIIF